MRRNGIVVFLLMMVVVAFSGVVYACDDTPPAPPAAGTYTKLINTTVNTDVVLMNTKSNSTNNVTFIAEYVTGETFNATNGTGTILRQTINTTYNNETITDIIKSYQETITQTNFYQNTTYNKKGKITKVINFTTENVTVNNYDIATRDVVDVPFDVITVNEFFTPFPPIKPDEPGITPVDPQDPAITNPIKEANTKINNSNDNKTAVIADKIPMQTTGAPLALGLIGALAIFGGMIRRH